MAKKILVADDDIDIVETVRIRLEAAGYEVATTFGEKTLDDARSVKPDLILLDVVMPGLDGFAAIKLIKRDPDLAHIPVIVFSGKAKEAMVELFGPEGIAGYISKPYDPKQLLSEVNQIIGT
jgi:CheY-like chemotaxis protein